MEVIWAFSDFINNNNKKKYFEVFFVFFYFLFKFNQNELSFISSSLYTFVKNKRPSSVRMVIHNSFRKYICHRREIAIQATTRVSSLK